MQFERETPSLSVVRTSRLEARSQSHLVTLQIVRCLCYSELQAEASGSASSSSAPQQAASSAAGSASSGSVKQEIVRGIAEGLQEVVKENSQLAKSVLDRPPVSTLGCQYITWPEHLYRNYVERQ